MRLEVSDGSLHDLGALQHEWQLHLSRGKQFTDRAHAAKQRVIDDLQRRPIAQCLIEIVGETLALSIDDATFKTLKERKGCQFGSARLGG